ncbi:MAG: PhnM protein [Alphaproteobacteria bacterium]|nr:MAG: PhnM protein [Alphaproteobacteria bacterium]
MIKNLLLIEEKMSLVLSNARVVTPEADVLGGAVIERGRIVEVLPGRSVHGEDLEQDFLIPGIVDLHTDNLEKHFFPRPKIDWNPVSAAVVHDGLCISVGVTTVFDSLSVGSFGFSESRKQDNLGRLAGGLLAASDGGLLKATHRLHWRCETTSEQLTSMLPPLFDNDLTGLMSLMDHTPGQRQYRNLDRFLTMWREEGESEAEIDRRLATMRSRQIEYGPANKALVSDLSLAAGIPLASHDDETTAHIDEAVQLGATIAEFPVTDAAAAQARARGMTIVMGGPNLVRGGSYSGNISVSDVAHAGYLDAIASDYVPRSLIECAFRLAQAPFDWPLPRAIATVTRAPAQAAGFGDRGAIAPGMRADLVRVRIVDGLPVVRGVWVAGERVG